MRTIALIALACAAVAGAGELTDHGPSSFMFHDAATGLYWFDPMALDGITADDTALISLLSSTWTLATDTQVENLLNSTGAGGAALETIMGPRSSTIGVGGPRWLGFIEPASGDGGYLLQSGDTPDFSIGSENEDIREVGRSRVIKEFLIDDGDRGGDIPEIGF